VHVRLLGFAAVEDLLLDGVRLQVDAAAAARLEPILLISFGSYLRSNKSL
jgi:hypothetical protein